MRPFDVETIFLGLTLRYGETSEVTTLTADRFIFDDSGEFGNDHKDIWKAVGSVALDPVDRQPPTLVNIMDWLGTAYLTMLRSLVDRLTNYYHIYEFDRDLYAKCARLIDKQGTVYHLSQAGYEVSKSILDADSFTRTCEKIEDIDQWASTVLDMFRHVTAGHTNSYLHISEIGREVRERWNSILNNEYFPLLDCGLPSIKLAKLFPRGKMAVVHGLSGSGKSSFVFQVCVGTALGLVRFGLPGCVAINSLEMDQISLVERVASILSQVDVSKFNDKSLTEDEIRRLSFWLSVAERLPIYIDATNFLTTTALQYRASGLTVSKAGPVVQLATDYGELFGDEDKSEEQRMAHVFRQQFHLARMLDASVIAISQSTNDRSLTGKTYIAGPDGTRYSKAILMATDILVELWNAPAIKAAGRELIVPEKVKDGDREYITDAHPWLFLQKYRGGKIGNSIPLGWIPEATTFFDLGLTQEPGSETIYTHLLEDQELILERLGLTEGSW